MFWQCQGLTSINLTNFDTSEVKNMKQIFYGCKNLTILDLTSFDTNKVTETERLFYNCTKLNTIYVNTLKLNMSNVTNSKNMFYGCKAIEGSNGTKYDSSKIDVSMAHVDVEGNPGYFSTK